MALSVFLLDALHLDGADLIDLPDAERRAALAGVVQAGMLMPRLVTPIKRRRTRCSGTRSPGGAEGVVVKSLATPYAGRPARRGLDQGEAAAHARPGRPRRRVGPRPAQGLAVQPAPGRARPGDGRLGDAGQDLQGPHR